jgi:hypothetical protein
MSFRSNRLCCWKVMNRWRVGKARPRLKSSPAARAKRHKVALNFGRDGSRLGGHASRMHTGGKAKIKISANSKLASDWGAAKPDENVEHYQAKLKELYEKFRPWIDGSEKEIREPELSIQESDYHQLLDIDFRLLGLTA